MVALRPVVGVRGAACARGEGVDVREACRSLNVLQLITHFAEAPDQAAYLAEDRVAHVIGAVEPTPTVPESAKPRRRADLIDGIGELEDDRQCNDYHSQSLLWPSWCRRRSNSRDKTKRSYG
jgi:hypothetical protein